MALFKRVFGKGDEESDKRVKQDVEKVESGQVNKIYPILKPGDWVGIKAGAIKQTLIGTPENPELVVGFGYDAPDNFIFLTENHLEKISAEEILQQAYQNLEEYDTKFERSTSLEGKILVSSGEDFSSEKILSKNFMMEAHEMLGAEELLVSIPRRRCMMVTSRQADDDLLTTFVYLHDEAWKDDRYGNAPIFNGLFVVKDGQIERIVPLDEQG